jgi:hypothetical protein
MLTNTPVMLCWSCLREEKGACSKSPYHRVASVTAIIPKKRVRGEDTRVRDERDERDGGNNNNIMIEEEGEETLIQQIGRRIQQEMRTEILDRIYSRARQRIRERGGMLTTQEALKLLLKEGVQQQVIDELFNEHMDDLGKSYPLLAENLRSKDEKTRVDALRVLRMIKEKMESPD